MLSPNGDIQGYNTTHTEDGNSMLLRNVASTILHGVTKHNTII